MSAEAMARRYLNHVLAEACEREKTDHPHDVMVWLLDRLETWVEVFL